MISIEEMKRAIIESISEDENNNINYILKDEKYKDAVALTYKNPDNWSLIYGEPFAKKFKFNKLEMTQTYIVNVIINYEKGIIENINTSRSNTNFLSKNFTMKEEKTDDSFIKKVANNTIGNIKNILYNKNSHISAKKYKEYISAYFRRYGILKCIGKKYRYSTTELELSLFYQSNWSRISINSSFTDIDKIIKNKRIRKKIKSNKLTEQVFYCKKFKSVKVYIYTLKSGLIIKTNITYNDK